MSVSVFPNCFIVYREEGVGGDASVKFSFH
jgi:hypothetical protein